MRKTDTGAQIAAALAAALLYGSAGAQIMNDPTRPPPSVSAVESGTPSARGPVLQSVIITPRRRSAIIDGERVEQGGRYGDSDVVSITENQVVLRSVGRTETVKLYPDVETTVKRTERAPPKATRERGPGR